MTTAMLLTMKLKSGEQPFSFATFVSNEKIHLDIAVLDRLKFLNLIFKNLLLGKMSNCTPSQIYGYVTGHLENISTL